MIEAYIIHILILIGIYGILALSLNFALGYGGLLNLGHIAFFGIGAYTSAILSLQGIPLIIAFGLSSLLAGLSGYLLSFASIKLKEDYLCLATLGFNFVIYSLMLNLDFLTKGAQGITGIPKIPGTLLYLVITFIIFVITYIIIQKLAKSSFGKSLQATRDNELLAQTIGKNTLLIKNKTIACSAFFAGIAGSLYAHYIGFIDPSTFGLGEIILLLTIVILGGLASLKGTILATILLISLPELLRFITMPSAILGPVRAIIYALTLLIILLYRPRGIQGKIDLA